MARNNKVRLINYHSATASSATAADLSLGEIAVLHKSKSKAKLQVKIDDSNLASFISEDAINAIKTDLQGQINSITGDHGSLSNYLTKTDASNTYETKTDAATKKTDAISSAKSYTDAEITKLTGDTDGSLQKQITANKTAIKGNSDKIKDLSAGTTAYTTTAVSNAKTELIGTAADTKDTKTIEGTRKYAESLATEITGSTTGSIGARLKAVEDKATANASKISANTQDIKALQGTDKDSSTSVSIVGAKKYADEKIAKAVSSVYKVKGTCTYANLPESGNANGDVWNVTDAHGNVPAGTNYVWLASEGGGSWDALAGTVDLSPYFKTKDFNKTLTADTSFTSVKNTAEAAATKNELAAVKTTAEAAAVKTEVDTALAKKVAKTDLGTYATQQGIQEALDNKTDKIDFGALKETVNGITGTTLNEYVEKGTTSDQKGKMTGYGLRAYANDVVSTAKATLEGNSDSSSGTTTIIGAKKYADAVVNALSDGQVATNTQSISANASKIAANETAINNVKKTAESAAQTVRNTSTVVTGVTFSKEGTVITLNLDSMVIDCGEF